MMLFLISGGTAFVYVFLRALQQLNVVHNHYWRIPIVSIFMGLGDVVLILVVVKADTLWIGLTNGLAGAAGCFLAMWLNRRLGDWL
jgi:hypothetical protein